jgi:hypothetical protein
MRINILWVIPPVAPFAFVAMVRALWAIIGLPWEPSTSAAGLVILCAFLTAIGAMVYVGLAQSIGLAVWVRFWRIE